MTTLTAADRGKLAKLLGLLSSSHTGERDAAALAATRFLKTRNLTWVQVLDASDPIKLSLPRLRSWRETVALCLQRPDALLPWEGGFLKSLLIYGRRAQKDRRILGEIALRVLGGGAT